MAMNSPVNMPDCDDDDDDGDDDKCQFVERPNIHEEVTPVALTGTASLPDGKQQKTQRKRRRDE